MTGLFYFSIRRFFVGHTQHVLAVAGLLLLTMVWCHATDAKVTPYQVRPITPDQRLQLGEMVVERPQTSSRLYVANYPADGSRFDRGTLASSQGSSRLGRTTGPDAILDETPATPIGKPSDPKIITTLGHLKDMSEQVREGKIPVPINTETKPTETPNAEKPSEKPAAGENIPQFAVRFFQDSEAKNWYAELENHQTIPVKKASDGSYYSIDPVTGNLKDRILHEADHDTLVAKGDETKKPDTKRQTAQHTVLLIFAIGSVLAALYVGFLAIDYKRRWEQEMLGQNQRLLSGNGASTFSDFDSLEPETLRFSSDFGSLNRAADSISDHPFRTIA